MDLSEIVTFWAPVAVVLVGGYILTNRAVIASQRVAEQTKRQVDVLERIAVALEKRQ